MSTFSIKILLSKHVFLAVTCLAEYSGEGSGTNAGEVGHLIDALPPIQTGLRLAFVHVWRMHIIENFICC